MRSGIFFALILGIIFSGCQAAPAETPTEIPTALPGKTPLPTATAAPEATSTAISTPTVSPAELKRRAGPICENAFSALVESGPLTPPFAVLKKEIDAEAPSWELSHQLPHLGSLSAAEVQTVFCVSETRTQISTYTDGSAAYQVFWEVRVVSWPGGKVIKKNSFTGSPPPKTQVSSSGSAEGLFPYDEFAAWVFSQVEHPDFLYFQDAITSLAISPDGRLAAFGTAMANQIVDRNYQAKIFLFNSSDLQTDLGTSAFLNALAGHQGMVTSLVFSPDGRILVSGGFDLFVKFWDIATGRFLGQLKLDDTPNALTFSVDGTQLAVATNLTITIVDPISMQMTQSIQQAGGSSLAFSPDGSHIYVNSVGSIKMMDTNANRVTLTFPDTFALVPTLSVSEDGNPIITYESPEFVEGFALSTDGMQIITYTIDPSIDKTSGMKNVHLATWDAKTGKYLSETKFVGDFVEAIKFSPDGNLLAIGNSNEIWLWDTTNWQIIKRFSGHNDLIEDLVFSPDGTQILSASRDGTIRVWSLEK